MKGGDEQRRLKRFLACEEGGVVCVYGLFQNRLDLKLVITKNRVALKMVIEWAVARQPFVCYNYVIEE